MWLRKILFVLQKFTFKAHIISTRVLNNTTPNIWKAINWVKCGVLEVGKAQLTWLSYLSTFYTLYGARINNIHSIKCWNVMKKKQIIRVPAIVEQNKPSWFLQLYHHYAPNIQWVSAIRFKQLTNLTILVFHDY